MKKIVVLGVSSIFFLAGNNAFAQFKQLAKSAKNMDQLQITLARGVATSFLKRNMLVQVPTHFVPTGRIGLRAVGFPKEITPVTIVFADKIFANYHDPLTDGQMLSVVGKHLASEEGMQFVFGENPAGKAFYEDQARLARDLDRFYEGKSQEYIGPDGRTVKFYPLPVDGILYKPVGYRVPVVLDPEDYFVIYDVQAHTGKIADNTEQIYNSFLTPSQYEQLQKTKTPAKTDSKFRALPLNNKEHLSLMYLYNKEVYTQDRETNLWKDTWYNMGLPYVFDSMPQLGKALKTFHSPMGTKVKQKGKPGISYIYEIPVSGLSYTDVNEEIIEINPQTEVFWYINDYTGTLIKREDLEENGLLEFVD